MSNGVQKEMTALHCYQCLYCASDFHIGYEDANSPKIEEFFELVKTNADELILCVDVLDLWRCPIETIKSQEPVNYPSLKPSPNGSGF